MTWLTTARLAPVALRGLYWLFVELVSAFLTAVAAGLIAAVATTWAARRQSSALADAAAINRQAALDAARIQQATARAVERDRYRYQWRTRQLSVFLDRVNARPALFFEFIRAAGAGDRGRAQEVYEQLERSGPQLTSVTVVSITSRAWDDTCEKFNEVDKRAMEVIRTELARLDAARDKGEQAGQHWSEERAKAIFGIGYDLARASVHINFAAEDYIFSERPEINAAAVNP